MLPFSHFYIWWNYMYALKSHKTTTCLSQLLLFYWVRFLSILCVCVCVWHMRACTRTFMCFFLVPCWIVILCSLGFLFRRVSCLLDGDHVYSSEKAMAPHSSTLAWKIPWTEEPGGLQSMGSRRVRHDWATSLSLFTFLHWRRKRQPTPVFLPGESQGRWSLVGFCLWGRTELDTTEVT